MTDKATHSPSPSLYEKIERYGAYRFAHGHNEANRHYDIADREKANAAAMLSEILAEVERLAAQAAPTDNELGKRTTSAATARSHEIPNGSESANQVNPADQRGAPEPVANGGDARGASGGCARPTACTHPACQCVAQSAPFKREDLTLAAVNCEHQIDADCVRLWRDETKEGTALSQLVDRVAAVVAQSAQPDAGEVRMLTHEEAWQAFSSADEVAVPPGVASDLMYLGIKEFCRINAGKRIPVDGEVRS